MIERYITIKFKLTLKITPTIVVPVDLALGRLAPCFSMNAFLKQILLQIYRFSTAIGAIVQLKQINIYIPIP